MIRRPLRSRDYGGLLVFLIVLAILFYASNGLLTAAAKIRLPGLAVQRDQRVELIDTLLEPTATPAPVQAAAAAPKPATTPDATPGATPTPTREIRKVGNTGGVGVYLRRSPELNDRIKAWVDGSEMVLLGEEVDSGGLHWIKVRDPAGNEGWIPDSYLVSPAG